jgi:hypothetical protein
VKHSSSEVVVFRVYVVIKQLIRAIELKIRRTDMKDDILDRFIENENFDFEAPDFEHKLLN